MRRLAKFRDWWRTAIASVSVLLGIMVHTSIETVPLQAQFIVGFAVIGLIVHSSEAVLSVLLDHFRWLRKFILGDHFVEGLWVEIVHDQPYNRHSEIKYGALISISFSDGELSIAGDVYDATTGVPLGAFSSRRVVFEEEFAYVYDQIIREQVAMRQVGFGLLFFGTGRGRPASFNGYFVDPNFPRPLGVYGKRIQEREAANLASDDAAKSVRVLSFVAEYRQMGLGAGSTEVPATAPILVSDREGA
jgi:hypothetical protein